MSARSQVRRHINDLHPYVPGEQPQNKRLVKLNTNENPYGPSPHVIARVRAAVTEQLRLYPHPTANPLREQLAKHHNCDVNQIIVGNGSDELLSLATRAFVDPYNTPKKRPTVRQTIQYFTPSYSLYPVLTAIHGAHPHEVPLTKQFGLPNLNRCAWKPDAALSLVTTPNAPSGRLYKTSALRRLCIATRGVVVLDEAYADFASENAMNLVNEFSHVLVSRTFSKAYSLCFQRIGYFVGPEPLITALHKIRDSYNVNGLGQVAAEATMESLAYYRKHLRRIVEEREKMASALKAQGFSVLPSATNFILISPPRGTGTAERWFEELRDGGILVRWFHQPEVQRYLRVTIGTPAQNRLVLKTVQRLLAANKARS